MYLFSILIEVIGGSKEFSSRNIDVIAKDWKESLFEVLSDYSFTETLPQQHATNPIRIESSTVDDTQEKPGPVEDSYYTGRTIPDHRLTPIGISELFLDMTSKKETSIISSSKGTKNEASISTFKSSNEGSPELSDFLGCSTFVTSSKQGENEQSPSDASSLFRIFT